jgi:hypothetical protein
MFMVGATYEEREIKTILPTVHSLIAKGIDTLPAAAFLWF